MKTKGSKILIGVGCLVLGYAAALLFGLPGVDAPLLRGDIEKAAKHKSNVVSDRQEILESALLVDTVAQKNVLLLQSYLNSRIAEMQQTTKLSLAVLDKDSSLKELKADMASLSDLSDNAQNVSEKAVEALSDLLESKKMNDYPQLAQEASISYSLIDAGLPAGRSFVRSADAVISSKGLKNNIEVAAVRDMWVNYFVTESVLTNDRIAFDYWNSLGYKLNSEQMLSFLNSLSDSQQADYLVSNALNSKLKLPKDLLNSDRVANYNQNANLFKAFSGKLKDVLVSDREEMMFCNNPITVNKIELIAGIAGFAMWSNQENNLSFK